MHMRSLGRILVSGPHRPNAQDSRTHGEPLKTLQLEALRRKERAHSGRLGVWRRMRRSERLVEHESPRSCHQHTEATRALGAEGALRSGCFFCVAALQAAPAAGRRRRPNKRGPQHRAKARYILTFFSGARSFRAE